MEKLKKIVGAFVFVVIAVMLIVPLSYMLRPIDGEAEEIRNRMTGFYAEEEHSLDIVCLGASSIYYYIDNPLLWDKYGITSYNFSSPYQPIFATEYLIDEIKKTQNPALFIIDARSYVLSQERENNDVGNHRLLDNMKYSVNRSKIINKLAKTATEWINYQFDIITFHGNWENISKKNLEFADNERVHELKGWRNTPITKKVNAPDIDNITEMTPIEEDVEQELRSLMDKCKEEDIQVLFLATPWSITGGRQKRSNYLKTVIEGEGFHYLDCNLYHDELGFDYSTDFYDRRHVNYKGAAKVTDFVAQYIVENFDVKREHSDQVEKEWDQAVLLSKQQVKELENSKEK